MTKKTENANLPKNEAERQKLRNIRKVLFSPCETREQLERWVKFFLNIQLPNSTVSEESNSNPLDVIWEIYSKALWNNDENFSRIMVYACRGGFKTLGASILEVLIVLHLKRNVAHMAAILGQSQKSQKYVESFFQQPYIRDFLVSKNLRQMEIVRYYNVKTGESFTEKEWEEIGNPNSEDFERRCNYIQIIACTMAGVNSAHTEFMCIDEVDVVKGESINAYRNSKFILDSRDGILPIALLTSTRKYSYGLVQQEIDDAEKTGLCVRHWNVIDTTQACPASRHLPDLPKVPLYVNDLDIQFVNQQQYDDLNGPIKEKFYFKEGFAGCAKCLLFPACKTRLATHQLSKSNMLKPISTVITKFRESGLSETTTELLCRKPDASGLIYPKFSREKHIVDAAKMADMFGETLPTGGGKNELIKLMQDRDLAFYAGIDWGFTHPFVVVLAARFGAFMLVVSMISAEGLELDEKVEICNPLKRLKPIIYADPESPDDIKTFKKRGFNMKKWSKKKGSIKSGVEAVRAKLQPAIGEPTLFFLKEDPGVELLVKKLEKYHFATDASGMISDHPDDEDDDAMDALRYMVMNVFPSDGNLASNRSIASATSVCAAPTTTQSLHAQFLRDKICEITGTESAVLTIKRPGFSVTI